MLRYTIRRLLWGALVILGVSLSVFVLFGPVLRARSDLSPARLYAGKNPSAAEIIQVEKNLGLDKPVMQQYGDMMYRLVLGPSDAEKKRLCPNASEDRCRELVGRLGRSYAKQRSVDLLIWDRIGATASLTLVAGVIWMSISIPVGIISAIRPRSWFDRTTVTGVLVAQSLPIYYFGLLALYFFTYKLHWFPQGGYVKFSFGNPWPWLSHLILPATTLSLTFMALYVRIVRGGMMDAMGEDYVRTARAKGSSERRTVFRHAMRNALLPVVTIFGLDLGLLLGGAILTEATFGLQGLGQLSVSAASSLDVPLTSGVVLFAAVLIVVANIVVDVAYAFIDPRIRLS
ncbi:MAG: ABC transporter permease [Acidimicrobiia bacterium]|nr:ABC transporter permease [Acidimicrobiia bacterium]